MQEVIFLYHHFMVYLISILLSIAFELMEHSFSFNTFLLDKYDLFIKQAVVIVQGYVIFFCVFHSYEVFNKFWCQVTRCLVITLSQLFVP